MVFSPRLMNINSFIRSDCFVLLMSHYACIHTTTTGAKLDDHRAIGVWRSPYIHPAAHPDEEPPNMTRKGLRQVKVVTVSLHTVGYRGTSDPKHHHRRNASKALCLMSRFIVSRLSWLRSSQTASHATLGTGLLPLTPR